MKKTMLLAAVLALIAGPAAAQIFATGDAPVPVPDSSGGVMTACQTINVPASLTVADLNVEVTMSHSWVGDLTVELSNPGATTVLTMLNRPGRFGTGAGPNIDLQDATPVFYNDEAASAISAELMGDACPGTIIDGTAGCEDNYIPAPDLGDTPFAGNGVALADFDAQDAMGDWMLCAADSAGGDTGTLTSWRLGFEDLPVELQSFEIK